MKNVYLYAMQESTSNVMTSPNMCIAVMCIPLKFLNLPKDQYKNCERFCSKPAFILSYSFIFIFIGMVRPLGDFIIQRHRQIVLHCITHRNITIEIHLLPIFLGLFPTHCILWLWKYGVSNLPGIPTFKQERTVHVPIYRTDSVYISFSFVNFVIQCLCMNYVSFCIY